MSVSYWQQHITIGKLRIPRFIGGPLDGITDSPFRRLVREFSPQELLYTEMRHVACVANDKTGRLSLAFEQYERPLNYQIACNSPAFIPYAIEKIIARGVDSIDLNIGCPANNVIKSGSGSALMADVPRLKECLTLLRSLVSMPLTIKIRAGFKEKNAVYIAQLAQDCGVDALAIHPRLRSEFFNGRPDYALAAAVKQAVSIPVLLSGNVVNFKTAQYAYEQTGVDGFLIGRGMWAKPWKLYELQMHAAGKEYTPSSAVVGYCALKHLEYMLAHYGNHGVFMFRKHLPFYLKGFSTASQVRARLVVSTSVEEIKIGLQESFGIV